jgi:CBS domain-containing protein
MMVDDPNDDLDQDESYFDPPPRHARFDAALLRESLRALPVRPALVLRATDSVTEAVRLMQREHRGCVVVTEDGTDASPLIGIFTERDVLRRIVDRGKNPATLPLEAVMTANPEVLALSGTIAHALNKMSVGGFRHVPVVDENHHPVFVVSVRDIVEFLVEAFPREVLTLSSDAAAQVPRRRYGA